ncbi:hypothetical protein AcetOrient_orf02649 [Acetobacter orientalis]|uniref:Uncharacterized protein n=1 Tax=Acetobacter orientalis TaxID=146474 RepID=A0A2Z5ZHQ4_9PROT|nr:hypothetical protein AcetOrient_orf02649 [Acetobacter orientalis]
MLCFGAFVLPTRQRKESKAGPKGLGLKRTIKRVCLVL